MGKFLLIDFSGFTVLAVELLYGISDAGEGQFAPAVGTMQRLLSIKDSASRILNHSSYAEEPSGGND